MRFLYYNKIMEHLCLFFCFALAGLGYHLVEIEVSNRGPGGESLTYSKGSSNSLPCLGQVTAVDQEDLLDENTILVQRTLRSGQTIRYNGSVVVMGDLNPGAEISATGNVVVMGALRGVVHAGAGGDENAIVLAYRLQPTQLRISNHITRPPDNEAIETDHPEMARIQDGVVTIETFQPAVERQVNS
jgi:septum site-determining protein MinC